MAIGIERPAPAAASTRTSWIVYGVLLASLLIYGRIAFQVAAAEAGPSPSAADLQPMLIGLVIVSVLITVAVIPLVRRFALPPRRPPSPEAVAAPSTPATDAALRRLFTVQVTSWAFAEAIAIYGLILSFLSHEPAYYLYFTLGALLNFALYRPRRSLAEAVVAAAGPERSP